MKTLNATHADSRKRKRTIIQAALNCFTEKGFTDTSIADICAKANASTGSLYHHFKSKGRLACAVYLEGISDYQTGMVAVLLEHKNTYAGISAVIHYHLNWVARHPEWARFLFQKRHAEFMGDAEAEMNQLNISFVKEMSAWFRKHVAAGYLKPLPRDILTAILLGACQEFSKMYVSGYAVSPIDTAGKEIADAVWAAVKVGT